MLFKYKALHTPPSGFGYAILEVRLFYTPPPSTSTRLFQCNSWNSPTMRFIDYQDTLFQFYFWYQAIAHIPPPPEGPLVCMLFLNSHFSAVIKGYFWYCTFHILGYFRHSAAMQYLCMFKIVHAVFNFNILWTGWTDLSFLKAVSPCCKSVSVTTGKTADIKDILWYLNLSDLGRFCSLQKNTIKRTPFW